MSVPRPPADGIPPSESAMNFQHMAENVPGALFQYVHFADGRNTVTYMSPRCEELWEVPASVIEQDASILWQMVLPEDLPAMAASVQRSADTLTAWFHEWRITTPSGKRKWLQGWGRPFPYIDGAVKWNSFILDVTERRLLDEEQRVLRAQLRQAQQLESLGRLAGGVAHDVNNMLTVVMGCAEGALLALPDAHDARAELEELLSTAARSAGLTRRLLAFARGHPAEATYFDAVERLEGIESLMLRLLGEHIDFLLEVPPGRVIAHADPVQFDQVVTNLVLNARDAMPAGGSVTVSLMEYDGAMALRVRDTGTGMSEETMARIFDPFFSTKPVETGTGLGLATVQAIVREWGGHVAVQSSLGDGTVFTVTIPVARTAEWQAMTVASTASRALTLPHSVIVCDDDAQVRRVVQKALQRYHIRVRVAEAPGAALALATAERPDALITDVVTGDGGGVALARQMREHYPALPVLFMTGYVSIETTEACRSTPNTDILRKPFRVSELLDALGRIMVGSD